MYICSRFATTIREGKFHFGLAGQYTAFYGTAAGRSIENGFYLLDTGMSDEIELTPEPELKKHAKIVSEALHDAEEALKDEAAALPEGDEKDEKQIKGERLSDEAWRIEEIFDLDPRPSGLWPKEE